jgi:predicted phage terminase large subunit-like protein
VLQLTPKERAAATIAASADLYTFTRWMFYQRRGYIWQRAAHHSIVCDALMRVFRGECKRLIINIPPRYSKTEIAVVNFIAWSLGQVPDAEFIHTSYSGKLATGNAWQTRELVQSEAYREIFPEVELRHDSAAKDEWRTTKGGCIYAVGDGGTITGYGAGKHRPGFGGAIIIDDPHKADEARSDTIRSGVIEWFQNTLESRKNDPQNTPIILIMQRLHERDLAGWLLDGGNGEHWDSLVLPAISDDGTALWPEKHGIEDLRRMQTASPYTFAGQYQQSPSAPEGNVIKPDALQVIDALPAEGLMWVRAWDLASSVPVHGSDPDWTVGKKWAKDREGRFYIADVVRLRGTADEVEAAIVNTAKRDGKAVQISLPQDPGQAGKSQILYLTKKLAGFRVTSSPETGDKITRAEPMAAQINVGNVSMLKAPWNDALVAEMRVFPNGTHDDQVDAGSRAFNELTVKRAPMKVSADLLRRVNAR